MKFLKNKSVCALMLTAVSSVVSYSAMASDGTVNITGSVTANTCTVAGTAAGSGNVNVALDRVSAGSLAAAGSTAGFKPFTITLSQCANAGEVKAGFETGANTEVSTGRLNLTGAGTAGVAKNVQLQLRNADNTPIKIGDNSTVKGVSISGAGAAGTGSSSSTGTAVLNYLVGYYATGAAEAGSANSSVTYSIIYP